MTNQHHAITNSENTCFNCLKEIEVNKIIIPALGWGSWFDSWSTRVNLCNDCIKLTDPKWWELEEIVGETDTDGSYYKYEKEIFNFINTLPLEGQELFWNKYSTDSFRMEQQDWIDYKLGILPHEKCKEYGVHSLQEIEAYKERFPICDHVKIVQYEDGSKHSRCPFGAFGNENGTSENHQTQNECYYCKLFLPREDEIEIMSEKDFEIYELRNKLVLKLALEKMKEKQIQKR